MRISSSPRSCSTCSGTLSGAPAASIVRDAAGFHKTLTQAKERNDLLGRHADKVLIELAKRLGASPTSPLLPISWAAADPGTIAASIHGEPLERLRCYIMCEYGCSV